MGLLEQGFPYIIKWFTEEVVDPSIFRLSLSVSLEAVFGLEEMSLASFLILIVFMVLNFFFFLSEDKSINLREEGPVDNGVFYFIFALSLFFLKFFFVALSTLFNNFNFGLLMMLVSAQL